MFQTSSKCTPDGDNLYLVKNASFFKPIGKIKKFPKKIDGCVVVLILILLKIDFRFIAFIETLNGENLGRIGPTTR
jgi:hypothetical protein